MNKTASIFRRTAGVPNTTGKLPFKVSVITRDDELTSGFDFVSFPVPTDVLVSRWFPGYRATELGGISADEALALTLGHAMRTTDDLTALQQVLASPSIAIDVMNTLLPRTAVSVKARKYLISERLVVQTVKEALGRAGFGDSGAIALAYGHAILRVLNAHDLIIPDTEKRVLGQADSYTVTDDQLRRVVVTESLRGIFNEARMQAVTRALPVEATPQMYGEKLSEMFRQFSHAIPEIRYRLEQFDTVVQVVLAYHLRPLEVPDALKAHASLISLASISNFIVFASEQPLGNVHMPTDALDEIRRACDGVLTVIQSAPSIESLSLARYAEHFGEVPINSPEGLRKGLVLYASPGQASKLEVADVIPRADGYLMSLVDPAYVKASAIAGPLTGGLLSTSAITSLANIVADEASMLPRESTGVEPELYSIGVAASDYVYLALGLARTVAYAGSVGPQQENVPLQLIYGVTVADQWRMDVLAATPSTAFFADPKAVIVYTSKMMAREPKPLPARAQSIGLAMGRDVLYIDKDQMDTLLNRTVAQPFSFKLPVQPYGGAPTQLEIKINVLEMLVGLEGAISRGEAFYASVAEPGVDGELDSLFRLALAYADAPASDVNGDKARSWLITQLAPIMMHPVVRVMTERAVNRAILAAKLDGRSLAPQMREVYTRAFFGVALALLNRFGKIDGRTASELTIALPTSTLTLTATLALSQIPPMINGDRR